jgi:hypothetical protein
MLKIWIQEIETAGVPMHDLVIGQGMNEVRLGLTGVCPRLAAAKLKDWIEDNTLEDSVEIEEVKA